ncbi:MAG: hypothetical protein J1E05_07115 [Eubacterium sp.]|nr:hypothetical protein [Eubacterium sp.]
MSNKEIVEKFLEERRKRAWKFVIIQTVLDISVAFAIGVIMARALENGKSIVPHVLVLLLVITSTFASQMRVYFGSFKNFAEQANMISRYAPAKDALKNAQEEYEKGKISDTKLAAAQKKFDEIVDEFAEKIKAQENK